ncbi:cellulase family glycosylhydrolase [Cohnella thailandensis]|uniref:Cellulase family glycosylhydrolase n=1 Tax=Cohnella thailandensis TaxID=557557 RepID=A0A841SVH4_9BACL|nr:cellulase family glycosylhydrolase [Cohnella thailandensis]MBB6634606.1 cellulase family glycosylhydrolase [Cohnella thailandensis]MBP1972838.1 endoglycosylceramidase [Cohnella thailandensis]
MKRLKVSGMQFVDEDGNQVIMNGLCFICRDKDKGYLEPDIENKLEFYAKRGFNLIRLGIFWDGVEPEPGLYDDAYLNRVAKVVQFAGKVGIYVFLDMHQDLFSAKFIDGAPEWATLDDGLEHPKGLSIWYEAYVKSPAVIRAADSFWANRKAADGVGLLDHYEAMWEYIADKFKAYSNIVGFEPMNEPYMGSLAPQAFGMAFGEIMRSNPAFDPNSPQTATPEESERMTAILTEHFVKFDKVILMPFYNRMLKAIRKSGDIPLVTGGNVYGTAVQTGIERISNPQGEIDSQQIYAPHGYDVVVDTDRYEDYSKDNVTRVFARKRASQLELGLPVIVGEWGNFPSGEYTNELIEHMTEILENYHWASTYHQYVTGMELDPNYRSLERGYPVKVSGELQSYHYDYKKKKLTAKWTANKNGKTILYFPDLSDVWKQEVNVSAKAEISIDPIEGASGGFVIIVPLEDGKIEAEIG